MPVQTNANPCARSYGRGRRLQRTGKAACPTCRNSAGSVSDGLPSLTLPARLLLRGFNAVFDRPGTGGSPLQRGKDRPGEHRPQRDEDDPERNCMAGNPLVVVTEQRNRGVVLLLATAGPSRGKSGNWAFAVPGAVWEKENEPAAAVSKQQRCSNGLGGAGPWLGRSLALLHLFHKSSIFCVNAGCEIASAVPFTREKLALEGRTAAGCRRRSGLRPAWRELFLPPRGHARIPTDDPQHTAPMLEAFSPPSPWPCRSGPRRHCGRSLTRK